MADKNVFALGKIPSNKSKAPAQSESAPTIGTSNAAAREFVESATTHTVPKKSSERDWRAFDPEDRPTRGINVRFNEHELALLRHLAKGQERSLHQTIKRLLMSAAREALEEVAVGGDDRA